MPVRVEHSCCGEAGRNREQTGWSISLLPVPTFLLSLAPQLAGLNTEPVGKTKTWTLESQPSTSNQGTEGKMGEVR